MTDKKKKHWFTAEPAENTESKKNRLSHLRARGGKQIRNFIQDENAVSAVIGFVLIMGIVLSASSIYFASQIPELTADYESIHAADVADDFSELKTVIDGIKGETFERTTTIKMSPDEVPILGMSPPGSNLVFEPGAEKFEVIVPVGTTNWWNENWQTRKQIDITNVGSSELTDFPAYIDVTYASDMQDDYEDLRFTIGSCGSGGATELDYEIENYTVANAHVWVRIPTLSAGTTSICMYYNNSGASSGESATGVWDDNFVMVQHMYDYNTTHIRGSTSNAHYGDKTASALPPTETSGIIGEAHLFDGPTSGHTNGRSIQVDDDDSLHIVDYLTCEAWINCEDTGVWRTIMSKFPQGTSQKDIYFLLNNGEVGVAIHPVQPGDWMGPTITVGNWEHWAFTYDGSAIRLYKNGAEVAIKSGLSGQLGLKDNTYYLYLGSNIQWGEYHKGKMDEVRISKVNRGADWIKQSYQIVANQGSIVTSGSEETYSSEEYGGVGGGIWEQNATTGFPYKDAYQVDNSSNEVKLTRYTPEGDLILEPGDTIQLGGEHSYDQVIIKNNAILYVSHVTGFLKIHANNISIHSGSNITADRVGYLGGSADRVGFGPGHGEFGFNGSGGGGASHNASGGDGGDNSGSGGAVYDDQESVSIEIGSGGGGGGTALSGGGSGGNGGGAIWLDAEEINIAGLISADGDYGLPGTKLHKDGGGGGGSGGGILIRGKNVNISGTLSAKGGAGGNGKGGGGGGAGGIIKIFYDSLNESGENYVMTGGTKGTGGTGGGDGGSGSIHKEPITYTSSITHYSSGSFISEIYNTTSDSTCYGEMTWNATLNGQTLVMKVRTSMFKNMVGTPLWPYCPAVSNGSDISSLSSVSDGHRYVQYRAELSTDDAATTPVLRRVKINYSLSAESPTVANSSGAIKFNSNYLYYPNQVIVYEHGAVIKWQPEGGFMLQPPPIHIPVWDGSPAIEISTVDLTGANYSYSGATSTSVKNSYKSYHLLADGLKYPNLTINVTTGYPYVWRNWFNKEFEEKEWDGSYYDVSVTDGNVEVRFYGKEDGVELYFEKTVVEVEI